MVAGMTTLDPAGNGTTFSIMVFNRSDRIKAPRPSRLFRSLARRLVRPLSELYAQKVQAEATALRSEVELLESRFADLATEVALLDDKFPRGTP